MADTQVQMNSHVLLSIKTHQSFGLFLVHYSVPTFSLDPWILFNFLYDILQDTSLAAALEVGHPSGCPLFISIEHEEASPHFQTEHFEFFI